MSDHSAMDDRQLLAAVARGDEPALTELYDRHAGWLSLRLQRRCHDRDAVSEALQDTFLAVWRGAGTWRGQGEIAAWLWGIAIRRLIAQLRQHGRQALTLNFIADPSAPSAEDSALLAVEFGDVGAALDALSPELRAVIQLTVLDGLTERDTARVLGLPVGTTKGRIRKAKRVLAEQLTTNTHLTESWT